jgi:DNA-binding MarR family transcriptional regulator
MSEFAGILERRLMMRPVTNPTFRGVLNIQVAFTHFDQDFDRVIGADRLSSSSYNVLRILRGHPEGHRRGEIAKRLLYLKSDVTRVIDVLLRRGLVERGRHPRDRRLSLARITPKGLKLLARLDGPLNELLAEYDKKLTRREWVELSRLLEAVYASHVD